jgi:transcriptional regulator with XRE-family HTH domain
VESKDIIRIARQRAGLTQQQLADRSGHPRESIARWESDDRKPSLATVQALVAACDLDLVIHLAQRDSSLHELVAEHGDLPPRERLGRLIPAVVLADSLNALRWLSAASTPAIVVGAIADVLQGAPQRPGSANVDIVSGDPYAMEKEMRNAGLRPVDAEERWTGSDRREPWTLPGGGTIVLAIDLPGTTGYRDLRRSADDVEFDTGSTIAVAHPRDLLRVADASPRENERARVPALRALLARRNLEEAQRAGTR